MRIAIIPARGGSKRIPRKNIKLFADQPMIAYAIKAAQESELFDDVWVSTDDSEIAEVAKIFGASIPFMRPKNLADDFTATVPVIAHAVKAGLEMGLDVREVCCIYPAVPFIVAQDLEDGFKLLQENLNRYIFPVTTFPSAIQRAFKKNANGEVTPFNTQFTEVRTQDLEGAFYDVGQFYWGMANTWLTSNIIHQNGIGLEIPEWRAVDIDTPADWHRAELMYSAFEKHSIYKTTK
ncbi:pseudaminic acid cytidylyltransferase [Polynucleobacter paneuropaeus]|jgi:pseudaminic acid cytidylyltransferase|uniref:pseudaminic acid cytidylyltransferase n=1 Tax=Polynucleobacter paneuropaeus TaxID=2527775 RepID=UPI001BFD7581|nr:pseudaminic acid cytidylyltransferase [Polynucleobacter paneuropaeus]MBT8621876.1 pseudaminic acid cytidylyltransferase [Polynucleobacter paneuropaeus]